MLELNQTRRFSRMLQRMVPAIVLVCVASAGLAQETPPDPSAVDDGLVAEELNLAGDEAAIPLTQKEIDSMEVDTASGENPEELRRQHRDQEGPRENHEFEYSLYGSARLHAISVYDPETGTESNKLGDGASRIGLFGTWNINPKWSLFGRLESGFDVLDTFTAKGQNDDGGIFTPRLYYAGVESDSFYLKYGKTWSAYYKVAGEADRFSIFGGDAVAVYNAGTDGGDSGTGRANDSIQTRVFTNMGRDFGLKPFNLNLQFQQGQSIPRVEGGHYGNAYSVSAWLENDKALGIGLAYHLALINDLENPNIKAAGIDGDASSFAVAFKSYGPSWLASLVVAWHNNLDITDQGKYIKAMGVELFSQWEFTDNWWLTGGGNWQIPDEADPDAGEYELKYMVLGMRYTLDSFNRMLYFEWRNDFSTNFDGTDLGNEFTLGVRWDFGYQ